MHHCRIPSAGSHHQRSPRQRHYRSRSGNRFHRPAGHRPLRGQCGTNRLDCGAIHQGPRPRAGQGPGVGSGGRGSSPEHHVPIRHQGLILRQQYRSPGSRGQRRGSVGTGATTDGTRPEPGRIRRLRSHLPPPGGPASDQVAGPGTRRRSRSAFGPAGIPGFPGPRRNPGHRKWLLRCVSGRSAGGPPSGKWPGGNLSDETGGLQAASGGCTKSNAPVCPLEDAPGESPGS